MGVPPTVSVDRAVLDDDVDGFQQAGAELIEAFCARGRE